MRNVWRFGFCTLAGTVLVGGTLALPPANTHPTEDQQTAAQTQSVSGKIASVEKNSFTLTVSTKSTVSQDSQPQPGSPKTMSFIIDKNTTVEGSLRVGSNADVTYRLGNGANIAISVHVTP